MCFVFRSRKEKKKCKKCKKSSTKAKEKRKVNYPKRATLAKGLFRLTANLLQPATVAVHCSKIEYFPIICSDLVLCNSCCKLQLV